MSSRAASRPTTGSHRRGAGSLRRCRRYRLAQPGQAIVDRLAGPLDEAIGVAAQHGAGRDVQGGHRPPRAGGDPDHQARRDISQLRGLARARDNPGEMPGQADVHLVKRRSHGVQDRGHRVGLEMLYLAVQLAEDLGGIAGSA
jgi:hypothetical protein